MDLCLIPENTTCPLHCHGNRLEKTEFDRFLHPSEINLFKKVYSINKCKIYWGFINICGAPILFSKATKLNVHLSKKTHAEIFCLEPLSTNSRIHGFHKIDTTKINENHSNQFQLKHMFPFFLGFLYRYSIEFTISFGIQAKFASCPILSL